ncbi:MAG: SUMF1/EgtB/PvdO family nonheme iron enzyme, partial [Bacteroidetes bacterium]|nr:SUMF1/EgtB/PvdO family nonheme iron enzyme [Bacteroidota bacterium]
CQDWFDSDYYEQCKKEGLVEDPEGPDSVQSRVSRGGSWCSGPRICRVSYRGDWHPTLRDYDFGFRLVLAPVQRSRPTEWPGRLSPAYEVERDGGAKIWNERMKQNR